MSSALTHLVFIKLLLPARLEVMTVSGLGTFSWGSREYTGEQLHKIMADWHNNAGNNCSVIETGDVRHRSQSGFLGEVAFKL